MKNILLVLTALWLARSGAQAQSVKNEIKIIESAYGLEKKKLMEQLMNLEAEEAARFWPVYDAYEDRRRDLGEARLFLIHEYVASYPLLGDKKATEITHRCFRLDRSLARLQRRYFRKASRVISPAGASQFIQVEGYLQNVVRIQIQRQLPFIGQFAGNRSNGNP